MKKVILFLLVCGVLVAQESTLKVVYNLTTGDIASFKQKILKGISFNKTYYESNMQELEVAVIIHGDAYKFFLKDIKGSKYTNNAEFVQEFPELKKRIASLADTYDIHFSVCGVGLKSRHIPSSNVVDFVKVIPNASIGLIDKQNEGFAYLNAGD